MRSGINSSLISLTPSMLTAIADRSQLWISMLYAGNLPADSTFAHVCSYVIAICHKISNFFF